MLQRISRIDDYRVFKSWRGDSSTGDFERVNVIYGINGSGKSTLASLLGAASTDVSWSSGMRVSIVDPQGQSASIGSHGHDFWRDVYVFNKDYVDENLRFDRDGSSTTHSLLILGKARIDKVKRGGEIHDRLVEISAELPALQTEIAQATREAENLLTRTARTLAEELAGVDDRYAPRSYNARPVRAMLNGSVQTGSVDAVTDLSVARASELKPLDEIPEGLATAALEQLTLDLCGRTVESQPLEELLGHPDLARWVQSGIALHAAGDLCGFCGEPVSSSRLELLARHFDTSLRELQADVARAREAIAAMSSRVDSLLEALPEPDLFDGTVRYEWIQARTDAGAAQLQLRQRLDALVHHLQLKIETPFTAVAFPSALPGTGVLDTQVLAEIVRRHNQLPDRAGDRRLQAARRLEIYRIETIRPQYEALLEKASGATETRDGLVAERQALSYESQQLAQQDLDASPLAESLTADLARLLGRAELSFTMDSDGYSILRGTEPALFLSEGEKNAISLLYFLKRLDAHDCDRANAIVVIDDPVSSLDANIVAGVSSHLWARLVGGQKCRQLFLLTHSFELFRSWTNQLDRLPANVRQIQEITCSMQELRVRNYAGIDGRVVRQPYFKRWPIEKSLRNRLRSEYHYLFWRAAQTLHDCQNDPTHEAELDAAAILPNVCRRLLEGFLSFKYPEMIGDFRAQVEAAIGTMDESVTRTRIVTYLHQYSHSEEGDISKPVARPESIRMLGSVFGLIDFVDHNHFEKMCVALSVRPELLGV